METCICKLQSVSENKIVALLIHRQTWQINTIYFVVVLNLFCCLIFGFIILQRINHGISKGENKYTT